MTDRVPAGPPTVPPDHRPPELRPPPDAPELTSPSAVAAIAASEAEPVTQGPVESGAPAEAAAPAPPAELPGAAGPLAGLRVLDAASLYAAPLISSLLADHGADVVKLEPPGGDAYRSTPLWPLTARGKRSVVLDLTDPGGRDALRVLVAAAHVIVINEPRPRLARRGLDPDTLLAVNPDLVIAHVSGYGADGPYATRPGNGTLGEAFAGLTHLTGEADGPPVLPSVPLGDAVMAFAGAFGVLAACYDLLADRPSAPLAGGGRPGGPGRGRIIDVNPVDAMLHVVGPALAGSTTGTAAGTEPPGRLGSRLAGSGLRNVFAARDGAWVVISISTPRQLRDLAVVVGAPEGTAGVELENAVRAWLGGLDRPAVLERLTGARLPAAPVNSAHDVADDPHLRHRRALRRLRTPDGHEVTVPTAAPRVGPGPADGDTLPSAGHDTAGVLREWGGSGAHAAR